MISIHNSNDFQLTFFDFQTLKCTQKTYFFDSWTQIENQISKKKCLLSPFFSQRIKKCIHSI